MVNEIYYLLCGCIMLCVILLLSVIVDAIEKLAKEIEAKKKIKELEEEFREQE